ncbi:MAG: exosortase/archaeosortase family protein, partial [Opitutales bacterium]|nr:exosortase/archaeosortase family protein [Opitutales bacterium]
VFAGSFLAAIFLHTLKKKVLFVAVSIVFALVLNVLRTSFLTVWSLWHGSKALEYDFFGNPTDSLKFTLGTVHDVAGWTAMIITFIMLLALIPVFNLKLTKTDEEMGIEFIDDEKN